MTQATEIFEKHWLKTTGKPLDEATKQHMNYVLDAINEALMLSDSSAYFASDIGYWKERCKLAEKCLEESPCDPDITSEQIKAWEEYHKFIKFNL